ncbi:trehalose-6-phosphate synthase, partial [Cyanobium sp. LEGE 06143]|uniref:trehalose-6-phosphate synthase n=1 Tax=Cyanobium sp. LEGE 06143 TaxID=945727 RepID=UPI001D157D36
MPVSQAMRATSSPTTPSTLERSASSQAFGGSSFVLVYHRSPYDLKTAADGSTEFVDQKSPNGIIPTLRNLFLEERSGTWISWRQDEDAVNAADERLTVPSANPFTLRRLPLTETQISSFYHVTSKESFWPILHSFPGLFSVDNSDWDTFVGVNQSFARAACEEAAEGATIWVHDYNLWLAPAQIRALRPDVRIAFFHHTPFPSNDVFSILPWRDEILDSLLCCDLVGFHIPRYADNFSRTAINLRGARCGDPVPVAVKFRHHGSALAQPTVLPWLEHNGRRVHIQASPVGTSPDVIRELRDSTEVQTMATQISEQHAGRKLIISASRVDYTKGNRLVTGEAFKRIPKIRFFGNSALSLFTKIASGYWHVADSQTGYTAINARALKVINWDKMFKRYGQPNDLLVKLNVEGFRVQDVPVEPVYNVGEQSGINIRKVIFTIGSLLG